MVNNQSKTNNPLHTKSDEGYGFTGVYRTIGQFKNPIRCKKEFNNSYQEIYRMDSTGFAYESIGQSRLGSYKTSILTINTAFKNNSSINSTVFQQFKKTFPLSIAFADHRQLI